VCNGLGATGGSAIGGTLGCAAGGAIGSFIGGYVQQRTRLQAGQATVHSAVFGKLPPFRRQWVQVLELPQQVHG
jgi:hypothetical protein